MKFLDFVHESLMILKGLMCFIGTWVLIAIGVKATMLAAHDVYLYIKCSKNLSSFGCAKYSNHRWGK